MSSVQNDKDDRRCPDAVTVTAEESGLRIDQFLAERFPSRSRAFFQRCIRAGNVLLDGRSCRKKRRVREGQKVTILWPQQEKLELKPESMPLDILWEDEFVLVLNKSPDLVVHPGIGNRTGTLVHGLLAHDKEKFDRMTDLNMRPGIVHRLDKDTSGVMVVAKTEEARRTLKEAFKKRDVEKKYLALVLGEFGASTGTIQGNIGRNPRDRKRMAVLREDGKRAVSHYRLLGFSRGVTLVEVRIETGRTHQIRVHFSHLNHPVLGDAMYGGKQRNSPMDVPRQMLHAWKLVFPHPVTGIKREYMAPPAEDFQTVMQQVGFPALGKPDDPFRV